MFTLLTSRLSIVPFNILHVLLLLREAPPPEPLGGVLDHSGSDHMPETLIDPALRRPGFGPNLLPALRAKMPRHDKVESAVNSENLLAAVHTRRTRCVEECLYAFGDVGLGRARRQGGGEQS